MDAIAEHDSDLRRLADQLSRAHELAVVHTPVGEPDHRADRPPAVVELTRNGKGPLEDRSSPVLVPLGASDQRHLVEDVHRSIALAALLEESESLLRGALRVRQLSGGDARAREPIERVPDS